MPYFVTIAPVEDFREGSMQAYRVDGLEIAIVRVKGAFYAFGNVCTHAQDYLTNGFIEQANVVCSFHGAVFDMTTGAALYGPAFDPLPVFPTRVEDDAIQVEWPTEVPPDAIFKVDQDDEAHRFEKEFII